MVSTTKSSCNNPNFGQTQNLIRSNACIISQPVNLRLIKHVAMAIHCVSNMDAAATDCKKKKVCTLDFILVTQNIYTITKVLTYCNLRMLINNILHHQGFKPK